MKILQLHLLKVFGQSRENRTIPQMDQQRYLGVLLPRRSELLLLLEMQD